MFKNGSFEEELFQSMEKNLVSNQLETKHSFNKLAKAADFLYTAATIFEKAGMHKEADQITEVLKSLAEELNK